MEVEQVFKPNLKPVISFHSNNRPGWLKETVYNKKNILLPAQSAE
jgi:hypothetical protein